MANTTIWTKLMQIQKEVKSFIRTEPSAKNTNGKADYSYTPGSMIQDEVRKLMNKYNLMLIMDVADECHEGFEYPVYKLINNEVQRFDKKELLCTLTIQYSWLDTDSGEETRTFTLKTYGMNGYDKSLTTALSTAERYIFLKFFHIPTYDKSDEADAVDPTNIPGISQKNQPVNPTDTQIAKAYSKQTVQAPPAPARKPAQPMPDDPYTQAVKKFAMFAAGTPTHANEVQRIITELAVLRYNTNEPKFRERLIEEAQALREGRQPNYALIYGN